MSGGAGHGDGVQVTPNRKTHVRFDVPDVQGVEPAFSIERLASDMARTSANQLTNALLLTGLGYTIKPYWEEIHFLTERTETASAFPAAALAPYMATKNAYRAPTNAEMPNVATGASGSLMAFGYPVVHKLMGAGNDWSLNTLAVDQAAHPSPDTADDNLVMDRVYRTDLLDHYNIPILFGFYIPGGVQQSPSKILTVHFSATAGSDALLIGSGRYSLSVMGDGRCKLFEADRSNTPVWTLRTTFRFSPKNELCGRFHIITIYKKDCALTQGGVLTFRLNQHDGDSVAAQYFTVEGAAQRGTASSDVIYTIPKKASITNPVILAPIRVDLRRDLKAFFTVAKYVGPTTAIVEDDIFEVEFPVSARKVFNLEWTYCAAPGTAVECKLYDAETGIELAQTGGGTGWKTYTPSGVRAYKVKAFLTGTSVLAPVFKAWKCYRDQVTELIDNGEHEYSMLRKVSITGAERSIDHEAADISISNLPGDASLLLTRSSICTSIETEYDPADSSKRWKLFRGYSTRITARRRGTSGNQGINEAGTVKTYPDAHWKEFDAQFLGVWQRVAENVSQVRQAFFDYRLGIPLKVTDVLRAMLGWAGFPPEMIDIPDLDIRLWSQAENSRAFIEPLASLADAIQGLVTDYLPHFLIFDPNLGTYGKWRLIAPSLSPYTNRTAFVSTSPGALKAQMYIRSYPVAVTGGGLTYATGAPTLPIVKGTLRTWVRPPEANLIVVSTVGEISTSGVPSRLTQVLVNPKSYNFGPTPTADPTHPDYLGRCVKLFVMNPAIIGGALSEAAAIRALNWTARRVYDVAAHAIKMAEFQAPLKELVHEGDATRVRGLRYYDPVTIDGTQFLIRNVNPGYTKDGIQMAMFQCEAPRI